MHASGRPLSISSERTPVSAQPLPTVPLRVGDVKLTFTVTNLEDATKAIVQGTPDGWGIVTTPNLHHVQMLRENPALKRGYEESVMVLPDGWPIAWLLSRTSGTPIKRIPGSDLLERVLDSQGSGRSLVLVGGEDAETLDVVRRRAEANGWVVTTEPAPAEEVNESGPRRDLIDRVARCGDGGVIVLGLGAPKQEIFAADLRLMPGNGYILCLGMSINFSAGRIRRAPAWMQNRNLEWLHRIISEPRRLGPRYFRDASALIPTVVDNLGSKA